MLDQGPVACLSAVRRSPVRSLHSSAAVLGPAPMRPCNRLLTWLTRAWSGNAYRPTLVALLKLPAFISGFIAGCTSSLDPHSYLPHGANPFFRPAECIFHIILRFCFRSRVAIAAATSARSTPLARAYMGAPHGSRWASSVKSSPGQPKPSHRTQPTGPHERSRQRWESAIPAFCASGRRMV